MSRCLLTCLSERQRSAQVLRWSRSSWTWSFTTLGIRWGGRGGGRAIFLNMPFWEQKTTIHVHVGHVQNNPQGNKLVQAYRSQEPSSCLLLTSLYLLDSLGAEVILWINFSDLNRFNRCLKVTQRLQWCKWMTFCTPKTFRFLSGTPIVLSDSLSDGPKMRK